MTFIICKVTLLLFSPLVSVVTDVSRIWWRDEARRSVITCFEVAPPPPSRRAPPTGQSETSRWLERWRVVGQGSPVEWSLKCEVSVGSLGSARLGFGSGAPQAAAPRVVCAHSSENFLGELGRGDFLNPPPLMVKAAFLSTWCHLDSPEPLKIETGKFAD